MPVCDMPQRDLHEINRDTDLMFYDTFQGYQMAWHMIAV